MATNQTYKRVEAWTSQILQLMHCQKTALRTRNDHYSSFTRKTFPQHEVALGSLQILRQLSNSEASYADNNFKTLGERNLANLQSFIFIILIIIRSYVHGLENALNMEPYDIQMCPEKEIRL